ncbi:hypothetical protein CEXT_372881 [Caerostris extrusa]|uniref:Uncharacterized protein n=1 Tax=Caerostris extrusa TaxID=172846 RepID=A0AAV4NBF5_CAEEX|nr:hypothetical protein CEXT_372881 [Caerostris extrusa]
MPANRGFICEGIFSISSANEQSSLSDAPNNCFPEIPFVTLTRTPALSLFLSVLDSSETLYVVSRFPRILRFNEKPVMQSP